MKVLLSEKRFTKRHLILKKIISFIGHRFLTETLFNAEAVETRRRGDAEKYINVRSILRVGPFRDKGCGSGECRFNAAKETQRKCSPNRADRQPGRPADPESPVQNDSFSCALIPQAYTQKKDAIPDVLPNPN